MVAEANGWKAAAQVVVGRLEVSFSVVFSPGGGMTRAHLVTWSGGTARVERVAEGAGRAGALRELRTGLEAEVSKLLETRVPWSEVAQRKRDSLRPGPEGTAAEAAGWAWHDLFSGR